jgi:tetratricopeptide (TPR) repeat protein
VSFGFITHLTDVKADPFIVVFPLLVWLLAGLIVVGEIVLDVPRGEQAIGWIDGFFVYTVPSLLILLGFGLSHVLLLRRFPAVASVHTVYYVSTLAMFAATGMALLVYSAFPVRLQRADRGWLYSLLTMVVLVLIVTTNLNLVKADVWFNLGRQYEQAHRWDHSVAYYERAVQLAPKQAHYYRFLGHAYLKKAQPNTAERPTWFGKAERALDRAVEISPLHPDHQGNLGNLYHAWADVSRKPGLKVEKMTKALAYYQESVRLAPQTHGRLLEDAIFEAHVSLANAYRRLGQAEDAVKEARIARDAAPAGREQEAEDLVVAMEGLGQ